METCLFYPINSTLNFWYKKNTINLSSGVVMENSQSKDLDFISKLVFETLKKVKVRDVPTYIRVLENSNAKILQDIKLILGQISIEEKRLSRITGISSVALLQYEFHSAEVLALEKSDIEISDAMADDLYENIQWHKKRVEYIQQLLEAQIKVVSHYEKMLVIWETSFKRRVHFQNLLKEFLEENTSETLR